jgi:hypothetical protein
MISRQRIVVAAPLSPLYRMSHLLVGISVECGMDGFDQIAFDERRDVVIRGELNDDVEGTPCRAAVEQHSRDGVCHHTRSGPDKTTHPFNSGIEFGSI